MLRVLLVLLVASPVWAQDAPLDSSTVPLERPIVSLFSDVRAVQTGDLLTVVLAERTSARRASESSAESSAQVSGAGSSTMGGFFGLDATAGGRRDADSRTVQSDLLSGTLTARVVGVDPAGNLSIEGERRLNVDGSVHLMTVSGLVRPADVRTGNTVLSYQIAGADVVYRQEGGGPSFLRGQFLTLLGTAAVIVGAIALGGSVSGGGGGDTPAP